MSAFRRMVRYRKAKYQNDLIRARNNVSSVVTPAKVTIATLASASALYFLWRRSNHLKLGYSSILQSPVIIEKLNELKSVLGVLRNNVLKSPKHCIHVIKSSLYL